MVLLLPFKDDNLTGFKSIWIIFIIQIHMINFKKTFLRKFTLGFALSVLSTMIYAIFLRFSIEYFLDIYPIKGGLNLVDLSYMFSIATWKFIFSILLELMIGDRFSMPLFIDSDKSTSLKMEEQNSSKSSNTTSTEEGKSSGNKSLTSEESWDLLDSMRENIKRQWEMMGKLNNLKHSKDLKFYDVNGALEVDFPTTMGDEEVKKLSNQIAIIDRIYTTKFDEFKELQKKDISLNNGQWKNVMSDQRNMTRKTYKDLFEK